MTLCDCSNVAVCRIRSRSCCERCYEALDRPDVIEWYTPDGQAPRYTCQQCGGAAPYRDRFCSACVVAAGFRMMGVMLRRN